MYLYKHYHGHYVVIYQESSNSLKDKIICHCDTVDECEEEIELLEEEACGIRKRAQNLN